MLAPRILTSLGLAVTLVGCNNASLKTSTEAFDKAERAVNNTHQRIDADQQINDIYSINVEPDAVWVSTDLIRSNNMMPVALRKKRFSMVRGNALSLKELASYIAQVTGVNIRRAPELIDKTDIALPSNTVDALSTAPSSGDEQAVEGSNENQLAHFIPTGVYRPHLLDVTIEEALNTITDALGIYWRYSREDGVTLYYFDSKSYLLAEAPKKKSISKVSTTGQTGAETDTGSVDNSSALTVTQEIDADFWAKTESALMDMRSSYGRIIVNPQTGHIHVTDSPDVVVAVDRYVKELKRTFSREARIRLMIVNVRQNSSDNFGLNLDLVYERLNKELISFATTQGSITGGSSLSFENTRTSSRTNGSKLFLDALSSQGKVSVLSTEEFLVTNYNLYNRKGGGVTRYLAQANTAGTGDDQVASNLIEDLFQGTGIAIYPIIESPEKAKFDIFIDQSSIAGFEEITLGDGLVSNAPQTLNEDYQNTLTFRNGEARVLLSYEYERSDRSDAYTIRDTSCLTGCNKSSGHERNHILYIMTAWIQ